MRFIRVAVPRVAGIYIPLEALPEEPRMIGRVLSQTYAISAVREVMLKGSPLPKVAASLAREKREGRQGVGQASQGA